MLEGEAWRVCSPRSREISRRVGEIREAATQSARAYPAVSSLRRRLSCVGAGPCERLSRERAAASVRHLSRVLPRRKHALVPCRARVRARPVPCPRPAQCLCLLSVTSIPGPVTVARCKGPATVNSCVSGCVAFITTIPAWR